MRIANLGGLVGGLPNAVFGGGPVPSPLAKWAADLLTGNALVGVIGTSIGEGFNATARETNGMYQSLRNLWFVKHGGAGRGLRPMRDQADHATAPQFTTTGTWLTTSTAGPAGLAYSTVVPLSTMTYTYTGDTFWLVIIRTATSGNFNIAVDGGADQLQTITPSGTPTAQLITIPLGASGSHTVVISAPVTGILTIACGAIMTAAGINWANFSFSGFTSSQNNPSATTHLWMNAVPLSLVIIEACDANDYINQLPLATSLANLTAMYTAAHATGASVLLVTDPRQSAALAIPQASYQSQITAFAAANNCALYDLSATFGSSGVSQARFLTSSGDGSVHPTTDGHLTGRNQMFAQLDPLTPMGAALTSFSIDFVSSNTFVTHAANTNLNAFTTHPAFYPVYMINNTDTNAQRYGCGGNVLNALDNSAAVDPRLASMWYQNHTGAGTPFITVDTTPGQPINVTLGQCYATGAVLNCYLRCDNEDGSTLFTNAVISLGSGRVRDANGTNFASSAAWASGQTARRVVPTGNLVRYYITDGVSTGFGFISTLSHDNTV